MTRLPVTKTYKLFIDGKFPRSESGRTSVVPPTGGRDDPDEAVHVCRASRKDVRDAVTAARKAQEGWAASSAYLRGQILYRLAEMIEGKRAEFEGALTFSERFTRVKGQWTDVPSKPVSSKPTARVKTTKSTSAKAPAPLTLSPEAEVSAAIDRLICFAGWADKFAQVLGCNNPVSGPFYNFTIPEPTGVVAVLAPDAPGLLGLVGLIAPVLCSGNAVVALAGEGYGAAIAACVLAEAAATSDLPAGVLNILTGSRDELAPVIASHRDIDGALAAGVGPEIAMALRAGAAENLKRVHIVSELAPLVTEPAASSPRLIEPFVEFKTVWHPAAT